MPSTVALRFRDLGADTIPEHRSIIEEAGYVWWAWWAKPQESIPRDLIASFSETIESEGSITMYLVDSGHTKLYAATCDQISASATSAEHGCPEPERAPAYYRTRPYKVWFRFTEIRELPGEDIREFSYDELPEEQFAKDPAAPEFNGKRVFNLTEMLERRHRTMYFLRAHQDGDPDHELRMISEQRPASFHTYPRQAQTDFIIQISDLHFSDDFHEYPLESTGTDRDLFTRLKDDVELLYDGPPAAIVMSGDFTWRGTREEFELARTLVSKLRSAWGLNDSNFLAVPGNHDIQWANAEGDYSGTQRVDVAPASAEANFRRFITEALGFSATEHLSMGRRYLLSNFVPIDIIAVNSSRLEQQQFRGYGYVGREQLIAAARELGWPDDEPGTPKLKILVLHHHVLPVTAKEPVDEPDRTYSLTLDAGQLLRDALELRVDLVLHGHMHQPWLGFFGRAVPGGSFPSQRALAVHGAGSVGVKRDHVGDVGKNTYTILEFTGETVRVRVRATGEGDIYEDLWTQAMSINRDLGLRPISEALT